MPIEIDFWLYLIIMILTGAWTGYITNDVAIKMLFKEYGVGKFKLGGVIVKTRKDLEKNLAKLVEQEIINHNTLKSQFHKPELKEAISKTVVAFFNESIYENAKNLKINQLPGFDETIDHVQAFLKDYLNKHLTEIFLDLSQNVELGDVISSEQAYNMSETLSRELIKLIKNEPIISNLINELYVNYQQTSIDQVVGNDVIDVIVHNLNELLTNIFDEMRYKHDKDISTLISKLYRDLDIETFIDKLESYLGDKKINYFINDDTLAQLYDIFRNYLKEPQSKESIEVFCEGLLIALKKIDKPIIELFSGDLRNEVEKFLETQLPSIIDRLIEIVQRNSHEIEELIESSIDQTIYDQQAIKRIILSAIRMFLIENFTQKYDIINKIVELLKGIDVEDLSKTISVQVVDILHQKSIASIIVELETNNILTARLISSQVHRVLTFLLERYLSSDIEHTDFLEKQLNEVIHVNLKSFINTVTVTALTKQIIYNQDVVQFIKNKISISLKNVMKLPINRFVTEEKIGEFALSLQGDLSSQLEKIESDLTDYIYQNLNDYLQNNQIASIINKNNFSIHNEVMVELLLKSVRNVVDENSDIEMHHLFHKINSIDNLSENVVNVIMEFLDNGLSQLLEGNISRVVEDNIHNLSNEEVLEMMQEFMGRKLKPLTILGAFLGGFVGIGLAFFNTSPTLFSLSNLLVNIPIYAALGYLTNVIAIYFIFRPYQPLFGVKGLHGIIPRQIPVLANAMGQVVSKNLLSEESIDRMIHSNEKKLKQAINENVKKDQYKILRTYLAEHSESIVKEANDATLQQIKQNNAMLAVKFASDVMKLDLNKIKTEVFIEVIAKIVTEKFNGSSQAISKVLMSKFKSSKTINEIADDLNIHTIEDKINELVVNELGNVVDLFEDSNYIANLMKTHEARINAFMRQPLDEVIPERTKTSIEDFLYQLVSTYLYSRDKQRSLSNYVINEITTILSNNDSIDELFGGRFIELINFNMTSILERIEDAVNRWLNTYKEEINESVTHRVLDELTVMQQVGYKAINGDKLIKDTVYRIIEEKLPLFVSQKMDNLNTEFNAFFDNLGKIKLRDARLELRKDELHDYLAFVFESKEIEIKTRRFITGVMDHFLAFNTQLLFELMAIEDTSDLVEKFDDILTVLNTGVYDSLSNRQEKISFDIALIINKFITKEILSNRVRNLTLGLTEEQIDTFVQNILRILNNDQFLYNNTYNVVEVLINHLKNVPIETLLDEHYLKQDLKKFISKIAIDSDIRQITYRSLHHLFNVTLAQFDTIVHDALKEHVLNDIINSAYVVISNHLNEILQAVDFKEVTIREINQMEGKQIKELFDSFGKNYFRKLEAYGLFGGVFAIEIVSIVMFIAYMGQSLKNKNQK
jgi:uncharacterized membrane protein YheB (UPF0754 family)